MIKTLPLNVGGGAQLGKNIVQLFPSGNSAILASKTIPVVGLVVHQLGGLDYLNGPLSRVIEYCDTPSSNSLNKRIKDLIKNNLPITNSLKEEFKNKEQRILYHQQIMKNILDGLIKSFKIEKLQLAEDTLQSGTFYRVNDTYHAVFPEHLMNIITN